MLQSRNVVALVLWLGEWLNHAAPEEIIEQDVKYIWPIVTWSVLLTPSSGNGLADASLGEKLSDIATRAFDKYVKEVLPKELELDPIFKANFEAADASRMNQAFLRWQKRVYLEQKRIPPSELSWDGSPIPRYNNITYRWNKFYKSDEYTQLRRQLDRLAAMYANHLSRNQRQRHEQFRNFIWAEIYRAADSHSPVTFTGSPVTGTYFARYASSQQGAQQFNFLDPRGINPPFGRTHNHEPRQGEVLMHPSWASNFLSPQPLNATNVLFRFACWPREGPQDFDWEDDMTGDYIHTKQFKIKKPKEATTRSQEKQAKTEL